MINDPATDFLMHWAAECMTLGNLDAIDELLDLSDQMVKANLY